MAKFNLDKVNGLAEKKEALQNGTLHMEGEKNALVGSGLLNESSKEYQENLMDIVYYKIDEIIPNRRNKMSMSAIEDLAQNIAMYGLAQPLVVRISADGKIVLMTGHRRLAAIKMNREKGKWTSEYVPCIVEDLDRLNLPLSFENKELFAIHSTNKYREKTDSDRLIEIRDFKEIYDELRENGVEVIEWEQEEQEDAFMQQIKGIKTRELIAQATGMSPAQVENFQKIDRAGTEELQNAILDNKLTIYTAKEVVRLPKQQQKEFLEKMDSQKKEGEQITNADLLSYKEKIKEEGNLEEKQERHLISAQSWKKDIAVIQKIVKNGEIYLDADAYFSYMNAVRKIEKLLEEAMKQ